MEKLDLTKKYKNYYVANSNPEIIQLNEVPYISVTGKADPSTKEFATSIEALYSVAYTVKFHYKQMGKDITVAKLEGLWSFDQKKFGNLSIDEAPAKVPRSEWEFRLLIRMPEFVKPDIVKTAIDKAFEKKQSQKIKDVEWFTLNEGKCVQMLHVGPYSTEPESLRSIGEFMKQNQLKKSGLHHEIYLSDFRKTDPEKLKTILREPVQ